MGEASTAKFVMQKTLKSAINCTGVGLHSGQKVTMTLNPAEAGTGIRFRRTDIQGGGAEIAARFDTVVDTRLCTTIGNADGVTIATIEHLMAALAGAGIDNAVIEVAGPEVPIMDGSAAPFLFLIDCAGVVEQGAPRQAVRVTRPVNVEFDGKRSELYPGDGFSLDFEIDFDSPVIQRQSMSISMLDGAFKNELSRARTFGFMHEVEALRAAGFAKGGSLDNAVVVSGETVLNEDGLRFDDEFVRHKLLDAVGDLYLAGAPILGSFIGFCTGHALNNQLVRALFSDSDNYEMVDMTEDMLQATGSWDQDMNSGMGSDIAMAIPAE